MPTLDFTNKRILVTGGAGFLGKQVIAQLTEAGADPQRITVTRSRDCDLRQWENCQRAASQQDVIIHLAAHVGGIGLNREKPAELFYDNLIMGAQLIHAAYEAGVEKFVCVGTICAIPNLPRFPSKKTTSGAAILRRRTRLTALLKKPFWYSSRLTASSTILTAFISCQSTSTALKTTSIRAALM